MLKNSHLCLPHTFHLSAARGYWQSLISNFFLCFEMDLKLDFIKTFFPHLTQSFLLLWISFVSHLTDVPLENTEFPLCSRPSSGQSGWTSSLLFLMSSVHCLYQENKVVGKLHSSCEIQEEVHSWWHVQWRHETQGRWKIFVCCGPRILNDLWAIGEFCIHFY